MKIKGGVIKLIAQLLFFSSVIIVVILISTRFVRAAGDQAVINEIYTNPTGLGPDNYEWIEIYNPSIVPIDLTDYSIKKSTSNTPKNLSLICEASGTNFYICNLGNGWLANNGGTLSLLDSSALVDEVTYGSLSENAPCPGQSQSVSRIPNGADTGSDDSDFKIVPVTKGSENILPPPVVYSDQIIITEIVPSPENGADYEFIELHNTGDRQINLGGWQIDDGEGGSAGYEIHSDTEIEPGGYFVFYKKDPAGNPSKDSKIALNDDSPGDMARLFDPDGNIKSMIIYDKAVKGKSYSKFGEEWQWTKSLTPGEANVLTLEPVAAPGVAVGGMMETKIEEARHLSNGQEVVITGTVSVVPGVLSSQYFYMQDSKSGIQVYSYKKEFPNLQSGDLVSVKGELSEISGERRIKIIQSSDILIIQKEQIVEPKKVEIPYIGEELEGMYVKATGKVSKTSGSTFHLMDGASEIRVVIKGSTGIKKPKMRVGDMVEISGIVSQYQGYYRILPTKQEDVIILNSVSKSTLPTTGPRESIYLLAPAFILTIWNLFQKAKKKRKILLAL